MHWSNNCSNPFTSSTIESTFDCPDYSSYNDRLFPSGYSKEMSTLDEMCDKYHEPVSAQYSKYSPLTSSNQMQIWTDIDQTQSSEGNSWGIMFPMKVTSDSDSKWSWDCDTIGNNVRNDLCGTKQLSGNYYPCVSPKASLSLHNLEHTLSSLNIGENRCENVPSPSKKTWALIVGRQGKTPPGAYKTYTRDVIVPESAPNITSNPVDVSPKKARFFVIKSYSEDDVYRSIKYQIWCSTENGNRKLDSAYRQSSSEMPIFLFFSVNGSGHFCGVAEMVGPVDYKTRAGVWAQGKWKGQFAVKWVLVKDVPNSQLRHIRIETNENKPVTNSRDVTEIPLERGRQVLKIVAAFKATSSIYDDFDHYEQREISESIS